jgi:hypothetical protein
MLIQLTALHLYFDLVVVGVAFVFCAPIAAGQVMAGDEIALD